MNSFSYQTKENRNGTCHNSCGYDFDEPFPLSVFFPARAVSFVVTALMIVCAGWVYYQQFDKPDPFACAETDGKTICTFKGKPRKPQGPQEYVCEKVDGNMLCEQSIGITVRHKGKAYILHHFDGKDVYVAE